MREGSGSRWALAGVAFGLAVLTGIAVGVLIPRIPVPTQLADSISPTTADTLPIEFSDPRTVALAIADAPPSVLRAPRFGVVTGLACAAGATIVSGSSPIAIDGRGVIALATRVPLWRSLEVGDRGDDARALQESLTASGAQLVIDGVIGAATVAAFRELYQGATGTVAPVGGIALDDIVWLPQPEGVISECLVSIGAPIEAGGSVIALDPPPAALSVARLPPDAVPGDRVMVVEGLVMVVDAMGRVTDPDALEAFSRTPAAADARRDPEGVTVTATWQLASPVSATGVPPSAIIDVVGNAGCVVSGGTVIRGSLLGSSLGYTLMVFETTAPESVELTPDRSLTCP